MSQKAKSRRAPSKRGANTAARVPKAIALIHARESKLRPHLDVLESLANTPLGEEVRKTLLFAKYVLEMTTLSSLENAALVMNFYDRQRTGIRPGIANSSAIA